MRVYNFFNVSIFSLMRYTHAIVVRIPNSAKFDDKKTASKTDLSLARKQQEDLNDTLREVWCSCGKNSILNKFRLE
jgi:hypothetical protein